MVGKSNFGGNIAYDDLREWLAMAERLGEVRTVKGANCEEDIGLAAEAVLRAEHGPCVVFEDIPDCPKGFRLLLNMFAGRRRNMTLGFPDHLTKWELSDAYREAYLEQQRIVPHVMVDDGPILQNIMMGDDVDVTIFPAPKWHEKDGGRYIGTGTYSITRDPEENWLNAGAYRAQVHDKKTVGIVMAAGHHGRIHRDKSFKRGEPLPVVMVLGGDPIAFFFGGLEAPYGVFELDLVGGLRGRPVKMVRYRAVMRSATIKQNVANAGVPGVQAVWCHEVGGARMLHAISITQRYPGHAVQTAHVAAQCGASAYASKYIVVVDEDVDVTSLDHLLWAMLTRTDPKESIQFIEGAWDSPADPRLPPDRRAVGDMTHSVAIIDACRPYHWRDQFPPSNAP